MAVKTSISYRKRRGGNLYAEQPFRLLSECITAADEARQSMVVKHKY